MKKYLGFLVVLSILTFGGIKVEATNDIGCNGGTMYSPITGQVCSNYNNGCATDSIYSSTTGQLCSNSTTSSFGVISPNGGEVYQAGQQVIVKWNPTGYSSSAKVSIALATLDSSGSSSNTFLIDVNSLKNDGIETITIPVNTPGASNYVMYLTIFESSNKWQSDRSDNVFTIRSNNEIAPITRAPSITVLSPNGGETYTAGQQVEVKWETSNVPASYKVILQLEQPITTSAYGSLAYTNNDGSELITLPTDSEFSLMKYGNNFKILANVEVPEGSRGVLDFSDNLFSINSPNTTIDTTPRIMYWYGKVNQHVDSNGNWQTDPDGVSGANLDKLTYCKKWFPNTTSVEDYKLETMTGWLNRGNVDGPFTSTKMSTKCVQSSTEGNSSLTVISPNGGEVYKNGDKFTVRWKSSNIPASTLLEVNIHGGSIFGFLAPNGTPNDGSETFTIGEDWTASSNYKITVGVPFSNDFSNSALSISDRSDNPFSVTNQLVKACGTNPQLTVSQDSTNPASRSVSIGATSLDLLHFKVRNNSDCNIKLTGLNVGVGNNPAQGSKDQSSYWFKAMDTMKYFTQEGVLIGAGTAKNNLYSPFVLGRGETRGFVVKMDLPTSIPNGVILNGTTFNLGLNNLQATNYNNQVVTRVNPNGSTSDTVVGIYLGGNYMTIGNEITPTPSITVLSPNGGETYQAGQQVVVKWNSVGIPKSDYIQINLQNVVDNKEYQVGIVKALNDGEEVFTLPTVDWDGTVIGGGQKYRIGLWTVKGEGFPTYVDYSDNLFIIIRNDDVVLPPTTKTGCMGTITYDSTTGREICFSGVASTGTSSPVTTILRKGTVSNEVKTVQSALTRQGYPLTTDGKFGPKTEEAVKRFQAMKGLPVTGIIDDTTMSMILSYILGL